MRKWEGRLRYRENERKNTKSAIIFPKKGPVTIVTGDDCHMMRRSGAKGRGPMKGKGEMIITGRSVKGRVESRLSRVLCCLDSASSRQKPNTFPSSRLLTYECDITTVK